MSGRSAVRVRVVPSVGSFGSSVRTHSHNVVAQITHTTDTRSHTRTLVSVHRLWRKTHQHTHTNTLNSTHTHTTASRMCARRETRTKTDDDDDVDPRARYPTHESRCYSFLDGRTTRWGTAEETKLEFLENVRCEKLRTQRTATA